VRHGMANPPQWTADDRAESKCVLVNPPETPPVSLAKALPAIRNRALAEKILRTKPVRTAATGPTELRVLTHYGSYLGAIWMLKTFYHFSGCDLPLHIHDGNLEPEQITLLRQHFPDATIVHRDEADQRCEALFMKLGKPNCVRFRRSCVYSKKLFDLLLFSSADRVIDVDSDILFFKNPSELLGPPDPEVNYYNRDLQEAYSVNPAEIREITGINAVSHVNSGLTNFRPQSLDLNLIEHCLGHECFQRQSILHEQTLHAVVSSRFGLRFLPSNYLIAYGPAHVEDLICRHYAGHTRPYLYAEGMPWLIDNGHLQRM
jgi:hypothetical protein